MYGLLRMIKVLDRASGVCLFTQQWKWHPHAHAEGVDALVLSFTQFAREIDGGDVVEIHFDPNGSSTNGSHADKVDDVSSTSGAITMITAYNSKIQLVLFHDRTSDATGAALKTLLKTLLERFTVMLQDELANVQPQLLPNTTLSAEQQAIVQAHFQRFRTEIEQQLEAMSGNQ